MFWMCWQNFCFATEYQPTKMSKLPREYKLFSCSWRHLWRLNHAITTIIYRLTRKINVLKFYICPFMAETLKFESLFGLSKPGHVIIVTERSNVYWISWTWIGNRNNVMSFFNLQLSNFYNSIDNPQFPTSVLIMAYHTLYNK